METQIETGLSVIQISPLGEPHLGRHWWRAELRYAARTNGQEESIVLSVLIDAGDHTLSAIQEKALARAKEILGSATPKSHQADGKPSGTAIWEKLNE
ncbi:hypothetical protein [Ralstonia mannitolilytica]|uniref:hypothetical protein n=1 Tax=Ralstonia mannitolilytica TaxID=105219 RepID=UPI0011AF9629|nr:hypothetical protein [Ralstonia mannitolilytica]